jgi:hypothetical protein
MIFSDLPSPAEASSQNNKPCQGFAQAGNRCSFFGIMLWALAASGAGFDTRAPADIKVQLEPLPARPLDRRSAR